jgi:biopolymer transport protein ExbB/TolQ
MVPGGTWGLPLIGLAGTIAGMLFTFGPIGDEPEWQTVVQGVGVSLGVTGAILIALLAFWSHR